MKSRNKDCHPLVALFLLVACMGYVNARLSPPPKVKPAFLQQQLPLTVVLTTPVQLGQEGSGGISVGGSQAITAVFSRPVIALGSDFGAPAARQKMAFNLSCPMPGKYRWVTTTIARFDPDENWPTDLSCNFTWSTSLTSYDGAPLRLAPISSRRTLVSSPLQMLISEVVSERAVNLTEGQWTSAFNGDQPEVPPDGKILLSFSYAVNLKMLQSVLKLEAGPSGAGPSVAFDLAPCQSVAPWLTATSSNFSLDVNTTCAQVTPKTQLTPGTSYSLMLPQDSRYHALAGPLSQPLNATVTGLRPFKIPFNPYLGKNVESGTSYRRLDLWLPHGLSDSTTLAALAAQIKICQGTSSSCANPVPFNLSLVKRGQARLTVPSLMPQTQYRVSVTAKSTVKDGFGQSLQASDLTFYTSYIGYAFDAPALSNRIGVIDPVADTLDSWPYITRSLPEKRSMYDMTAPSVLQGWELDLTIERTRIMTAKLLLQDFYSVATLQEAFEAPTVSVQVPERLRTVGGGQDWTQLAMPLRSAGKPSRAMVVTHCCDRWSHTIYAKLLLNTSLSVNVVQSSSRLTAWVLDSRAGGGPVAGALVTVYRQPSTGSSLLTSYWQPDPVLLTQCTTDATGACNMSTVASPDYYSRMVVLVTAPNGDVAFVDDAGYTRPPPTVSPYVGSLVADRLVVVPGDSIKITGFLQKASANGLQLPAASYAALVVSPGWTTSSSSSSSGAATETVETAMGMVATSMVASDAAMSSSLPGRPGGMGSVANTPPVNYVVKINGTTGTLHVEIPAPADARLQQYSLTLVVPESPVDPSGPEPSADTRASWGAVSGATLGITLADPRPPTAELKVETPAWVRPTGVVSLSLTAVSYIGARVDGSPITVTWHAGARAGGVLTLTTGVDGVANGTIDLGALPVDDQPSAYDKLAVDAEWIGPTRERITQSAIVILADASASLTFELSLSDPIPGTAFALSTTLTSNENGAALPGRRVTVTLRPATSGATCETTSSCNTTTGVGMDAGCQLVLPCVGHFVLEACTVLPAAAGTTGERVCTNQTLGKNVTEWAETPLQDFSDPQLITDKPSYTFGDTVALSFQNPWPGARVLLHWGNEFRSTYRVVQSLSTGLVRLTLGPLGDECLGGCAVLALVDVPRRPAGTVPLPPRDQLTVSRLFDPDAPHTFSMTINLDVRTDNALAVGVAVAPGEGVTGSTIRDVAGGEVLAVEPGAEAQITVQVKAGTAPLNTSTSGPVEVTVYAVDKAFLDLLPYNLPLPQQQVLLQLVADIASYGMDKYRLAPGAVRAVFDKLLARLTTQDPWLPLDVSVNRDSYGSAVDLSDADYLAQYHTALTYLPSPYYPRFNNRWPPANGAAISWLDESLVSSAISSVGAAADYDAGAPEAPNKSTNSAAAATTTSPSLRVEADFVVTPLFATATAEPDGSAVVTFKAPQNLGTLVIRAFAAAGSVAKYGAGEGKLAVRRRVSLTPSVPRFVRVGDKFEAGVVVTVGSAPASVSVSLKVEEAALSPLTLLGVSSKQVVFTAGGGVQKEVRFSFVAAAVGSANLTFTATDEQAGGGQDALQLDIPVQGQQGDVYVATSFALAATPAGGAVQWQEGMDLPAAVPGSGGLTLTAGVGYFPALASMYGNLLQQDEDRTYPYAMPAMLWSTLPAVLSYYGQPASTAQSAAVLRGFSDLTTLTSGSVGLMWSDPTRYSGWYPTRTDLYLNTWALFLVSQHSAALTAPSSQLPATLAPFVAPWTSLGQSQVQQWRSAVEQQLVNDAAEARASPYEPRRYSDWHTLAWARLVLGAQWTPTNAAPELQSDLSLATLISNNVSMSRQSRVVLAMVLHSLGSSNPAPALLTAIRNEVTSALRVQGRTAYVAAGPGIASASSTSDQALCLLLLLWVAPTNPLLPRLAAYVADPAASAAARGFGFIGPLPGGLCPYDQGLAVAALTEYDRVRGSAKPNVQLAADANGLIVLQAAFTPGGSTSPVSNTTAWEALPPPPQGSTSDLSFQVIGTGEVSVAASLHFVPVALLAFPTYRGLFVEGVLQLVNPLTGQPTGRRLSAVPLGSTVAYTVQLTTPDDLGAVTLSVSMPGGLEPLDPNIAQGLGYSCGDGWVDSGVWGSMYRWWWWPMCPAQETRPPVVTFSYLALRAGTSSVTIRAVAATVGTFVLPPIRASVDLQPEVMGLSAAGTFSVCGNCSAPTYGSTPAPLKPCANDCSGNGICNLRTGKCTCDPSWTRSDCSRPVA